VGMADDAIRSAVFTGNVAFRDQELQASGGEAIYAPDEGTLRLTAGTDKAQPRVADDQVTIDAVSIDLTLDGRRIAAMGGVKTTLKARAAGARAGAPDAVPATKLPGLLKQEQPANVTATTLAYDGGAGKAAYDGNAALVQGDTAIRADRITIDQEKGDLFAAGNARSTFALDSGTSIGQANTIAYADAARTITYDGVAAKAPAAAVPARLSGTQGDLRAERIQILLAATGNRAERLEAYTNVSLALDQRKASGARLTYYAVDDRYVMTGTGTAPVKVVDNCRETSGKTLIFFKSADRMIVDGNEEIRTQTTNGGACTSPPARPR
jgi:lipopolysaccharide export system protein LptA